MVDVTDDFNRANGGLGANWTTSPSFSAPAIVSNQVTGPISAQGAAYYSASDFDADQHAQITISDNVDDVEGPIVRHQAAASSFYVATAEFGNQQIRVRRYDAGTPTDLGATGGGSAIWVDGDTCGIEITGSTINVFRNGVQVGGDFVDGTYTVGKPGIFILDNQDLIDDFVAGPIAASVFSSTASASVAFVGAGNFDGVLVATGVGAAAFVGETAQQAALDAAGTAVVAFVGSALVDALLSAAGEANAVFQGSPRDGVLAAAGVSTTGFFSESIQIGDFAIAGVSEVMFIGEAGLLWTPEAPLANNWTPEEAI